MGRGPKVGATAIIWAFTTGSLGICVPIIQLTGTIGLLLPVAVIISAGAGTIAIWQDMLYQRRQLPKLVHTLQTLGQRVESLEAICSTTDLSLMSPHQSQDSKDATNL